MIENREPEVEWRYRTDFAFALQISQKQFSDQDKDEEARLVCRRRPEVDGDWTMRLNGCLPLERLITMPMP
jgi:hypothetical protein